MKITIKTNMNDWKELYIDGILAMANHDIQAEELLETIKQNADFDFEYEVIEVDDDEWN